MLATFSVPEGRPDFVGDLVARWREVRRVPAAVQLPAADGSGPRLAGARATTRSTSTTTCGTPRSPAPDPSASSACSSPGCTRRRMDRRYPLWECHVIEGLEDGQWSMYMKVHHSQIDGVGGIRLLKRILSADPDAREMLPPWAVGTQGPGPVRPAAEGPRRESPTQRPAEPAAAARRLARRPSRSLQSLGRTYAESVGRPGRRRVAPSRSARRRRSSTAGSTPRAGSPPSTTPIDRLRAVAAATGGSLNDVFLAICGGALRRYLHRGRCTPARAADRERAGLGAPRERRRRRQRDHVPVLHPRHRHRRPGAADHADPGIHPAGQGPPAPRSADSRWTPTPPC